MSPAKKFRPARETPASSIAATNRSRSRSAGTAVSNGHQNSTASKPAAAAPDAKPDLVAEAPKAEPSKPEPAKTEPATDIAETGGPELVRFKRVAKSATTAQQHFDAAKFGVPVIAEAAAAATVAVGLALRRMGDR